MGVNAGDFYVLQSGQAIQEFIVDAELRRTSCYCVHAECRIDADADFKPAAKLSGDFVQAGKFACAVCDDPTAGKCVAQVFIGFSRCRVADVIFCNAETFCKANLSG